MGEILKEIAKDFGYAILMFAMVMAVCNLIKIAQKIIVLAVKKLIKKFNKLKNQDDGRENSGK